VGTQPNSHSSSPQEHRRAMRGVWWRGATVPNHSGPLRVATRHGRHLPFGIQNDERWPRTKVYVHAVVNCALIVHLKSPRHGQIEIKLGAFSRCTCKRSWCPAGLDNWCRGIALPATFFAGVCRCSQGTAINPPSIYICQRDKRFSHHSSTLRHSADRRAPRSRRGECASKSR
jgi:hypothetical protein